MADFRYSAGIDVNLNIKGASGQLQELQKQLQQISNMKVDIGTGNLTADIEKASEAAMKLSAHLATAMNPRTGNLDFTKFYTSIQKSGASLQEYGEALQRMGPVGQKAFVSLADSISKSEIPLKRTSQMVDKMWDGLKRTASWQLQSSIIHGIMGSIQSAVGYAKDLNSSLNDIRIVTGQSTDQMAKFAKEANQAAKSLSTTTTDYTKASLIYYQQGLSDAEVKQRTEATIKMANVSGQSAENVSSQMTAIWNNFDNGSKSLQYYGDVITALGAKTASSSEEIAQGIQKFAAISDTIGLSYEYAASALATVTATTRESADVVGNAYKTLFSRIQGLNLGETLDDGTTLNKYSTALAKVGISIKDSSGNLKDMDSILNEMGSKWETLSKDQQMGLAQTVAGVRQYTQLVALMDNWDTFQQNLQTAKTSSGTLDAQAAIYAESWEAASDRVRASWEGLWDNLIDSEGFITILDMTSGLVGILDNMITGLGGAGGALATFGGILTKVFNKQIASTISDVGYTIKMLNPKNVEAMKEEQIKFINSAKASLSQDFINPLYGPNESQARKNSLESSLNSSLAFLENQDHMSQQQLLIEQMYAQQYEEANAKKINAARNLDLVHQTTSGRYFDLYSDKNKLSNHYLTDNQFFTTEQDVQIKQLEAQIEQIKANPIKSAIAGVEDYIDTNKINKINSKITTLRQQSQTNDFNTYESEMKGRARALVELRKALDTAAKADSKTGALQGLRDALDTFVSNPAISDNIRESDYIKSLRYGVKDKDEEFVEADYDAAMKKAFAQFAAFSDTTNTGLATNVADRIIASGQFKGDESVLHSQIQAVMAAFSEEQMAQYLYDQIPDKKFDPNNENDPRVQNMKKQETQNKAEAAVAGAQGIMQTLAAIESFKALGQEIENLGNGTASLTSILSGITSLSLNAASGFQGLHMAMSQFFTTLDPKAVTGWSLGIMGALAAVSLAFEAFDYFTTSTEEYATSIARSTQNLQNAATTTAKAFEQSQSDSETHLANVRKIESYSQDPSEMANAIYEANKQAIDMITKYGQNWIEGNEYSVDQNNGLIKIKESTLKNVQEEKESIGEDFERTANLAQATQQLEQVNLALENFRMIGRDKQVSQEMANLFLESLTHVTPKLMSQYKNGEKDFSSILQRGSSKVSFTLSPEEVQQLVEIYEKQQSSLGLIDLTSQQNIGKILQEQGYTSQNTQEYKFLQEQASEVYSQAYQDALNNYNIGSKTVGGLWNGFNQIDENQMDIIEEYLEAQGRYGVEKLKYRNGEIKYYSSDTSGEQSIEWEDVKRWKAEQEAEKAVIDVGDDGKSWLDKQIEINQELYKEQGKGAEAILSYGEFDSLNQVSIKALKAADNISEASDQITTALKGKTFTDFTQAVDKALEPVDTFESLFKNLGETTIDYGTLSVESLQNFNNSINDFVGKEAFEEAQKWLSGDWESKGIDTNKDGKKTFEDMSSEAQNLVKYTEGIEQMLQTSGLDAESMAQAFNQIAQMDWSDDAGANLRNIIATINNLGGDINIADWDHLRGIMQDLGGAMPDYSGTIAQLIQIQQLLNSLKSGDSVTTEINVLLNMMGINTISDGKGGFIVTSSQEEIDNAARSNQGEINDKVTAARNTQAAYNDYKNKVENQGGQARITGFESYEDLVNATNPNSENYDQGLTDFLNTVGGNSLNQSLVEAETATQSATDNRARWQQLLGIGADKQQEAEEASSNAQQAALDIVNDIIETGQSGASTEDIQSLAATYKDAARLMEAINSDNSAFRDENGLVDSGTLEYLQTLPETSERATAAIDAFAEAESRLQELRNSEASEDEIERAQRISDEAAAYAELQTQIDKIAVARGLDADQMAYQAELMEQEGIMTNTTAKAKAEYAAELVEQSQAIKELNQNWSQLQKSINSANSDTKYAGLSKLQDLLNEINTGTHLATKSTQQFEKAYSNFIKNGGNMQKLLKGDREELKKLSREASKVEMEDLYKKMNPDDDGSGLEKFLNDYKNSLAKMEGMLEGVDLGIIDENDFENGIEGVNALEQEFSNAVQNLVSEGMSAGEAMSQVASDMGVKVVPDPVSIDGDGFTADVDQGDFVPDPDSPDPSVGTVNDLGTAHLASTVASGQMTGWHLEKLGGGGSPGGGGGGGGGGAKEPKKVANKRKSQTVKRYKRNDAKRSSAEQAKKSEENKKDYLYGESKIAQMEKINKLAEKEARITADRIKESRTYLIEDRENLIKYLQKYGYEAEFDADGFLANYEQVWTDVYEQIAALYEDNLLTEEEEKIEEDLNVMLEELEGALEDYENSLSELQDDIEAYEETLFEMYDNKVEALEHKVEFKIELSEDDLDYLDFWIESLGDNVYNALEAIEAMGAKANALFDGLETYQQGIIDIMSLSDDPLQVWATGGIEGILTQAQVDALRDNRDGLADYMQQLIDLRDEIKDKVLDTFDDWQEKLDSTLTTIEHYTSVLEHFKNMIDVVGKDSLGLSNQFMANLEQSAINQSLDSIDANKAYYDNLVEIQQEAQQKLEEARARGDQSSADHWEEVVQSTIEAMQDAQDALLTSLEDSLNLIAEQFETNMERAIEAFNDAIYAYGGLEGLSNDYSLIRENADLMAADYEKIYELSKITRNINKTLDDTNIIAGKQKLISLQKEINNLQNSGVELSKYDLEYLQAKYELRLAEIELENAQNAKDTVRLSRDSEGNWSYIYTQNADAVEEAGQKYEDALYEIQKLSQEYLEEMSSSMLDTSSAMMEEISGLRIQDFNSYEEYQAEIKRIQDKYAESLKLQEAELNKAVSNSQQIYEQDWRNYNLITGYKISESEKWIDAFRESTIGQLLNSDTIMSSFSDTFLGLTEVLTKNLADSAVNYFTNIDKAFAAYGTSIEDFGKHVEESTKRISDKSKEAATDAKTMAAEMNDAFKEIADTVADWQEQFSGEIDKMLEKIKTLIQDINEVIETSANLQSDNRNSSELIGQDEAIDLLNEQKLWGTWERSENGALTLNGNATTFTDFNGELIQEIDDKMTEMFNARTGSEERLKLEEEVKELFKQYWLFRDIVDRVYDVTDLQAPKYASLDTGGYTGEWGDSGKFAMLHEKELVLNKDDTKNFLDALNLSKDVINSMIEMNAKQSSLALGNLVPTSIQDMSQVLEQSVTIQAEFPNAVDHSEIEEAFNNLINTASQYANRRK